jgi:hypothetical protein
MALQQLYWMIRFVFWPFRLFYYPFVRISRIDSISKLQFDKGPFFFMKFFYSEETGLVFIKEMSWTILPRSFVKINNYYLIGKYGRNTQRDDVQIFKVTFGQFKVWKVLFGIRHIHKISYSDDYLFITTGDIASESKILILNLKGDILRTICCDQLSRTTDVHLVSGKLYWIMDSEYEDSFCCSCDLHSEQQVSKHFNIRQPSWHSIKFENRIYFTSTVEFRSVNKGKYCILYCWNLDLNTIQALDYYKSDFLSKKYFPASSVELFIDKSVLIVKLKGCHSLSSTKTYNLMNNVYKNMNLSLVYCETHTFMEIQRKYGISRHQFILNVLNNCIVDEKWYNFYLKRVT